MRGLSTGRVKRDTYAEPMRHVTVESGTARNPAILAIGDNFPSLLHGAPFFAGVRRNALHLVTAASRQRRQGHAGTLAAYFSRRCRQAAFETGAASRDRHQ